MELEVSRNLSAHAHGEEKHKVSFRNEHVSSVCQGDYTSPSHGGSWGGWAQLSPVLQSCPSGMGLPECCLSQGCASPCSVSVAPQLPLPMAWGALQPEQPQLALRGQ